MNADLQQALCEQVVRASAQGTPLSIVGGASKNFYGRTVQGEALQVAAHAGVVNYEPTELVLTARCGTRLADIETLLLQSNQMLAFEPPHFAATATLGGCVAAGLSGPRRPYAGSVRDHVLGMKIINGQGEVLHFGGEVMKNVAGYDISRLMTGALGTLGVMLDISIKVLPRPASEVTLAQQVSMSEALTLFNQWAGKPFPISAACHDGEALFLRLSGATTAVKAAQQRIGGEVLDEAAAFWRRLREHQHAFFQTSLPLWRIALAPATPLFDLPGKWLLDWGGAQRWLISEAEAEVIRSRSEQHNGHAQQFRRGDCNGAVFQPLPPALAAVHRRLKQAFDPAGIFNPGRMYAGL